MPAGYDADEEAPAKGIEDEGDDDLPELDEAEEEKLKNDESLKWDEDEEKDAEGEEGEKKKGDPGEGRVEGSRGVGVGLFHVGRVSARLAGRVKSRQMSRKTGNNR
jgi:hypothetical protein